MLRRKSIKDSSLYHNTRRQEGDIYIFTLRHLYSETSSGTTNLQEKLFLHFHRETATGRDAFHKQLSRAVFLCLHFCTYTHSCERKMHVFQTSILGWIQTLGSWRVSGNTRGEMLFVISLV